jgi:hypothetical protein
MESKPTDPNALLLQVMAHDLLAPLTAVKWQLELLERVRGDADKCEKYNKGIRESTELGIMITKHAHVAGKVLVGAYGQNPTDLSLPEIIRGVITPLHLQYERHGVSLDIEIDDEKQMRQLDKELVELFTWSIAKYFLTCVPAQTTVSFRGLCADREGGTGYLVVGSAMDVPECDTCVSLFNTLEARSTYDQTFVFAKLIHETAVLLGVNVSASTQGNNVLVEAEFVAPHSA